MKLKKLLSGLTSLALSLTAFTGLGLSEQVAPIRSSAAQSDWKFDFGGSGAAAGYTGVSATDGYNAGRGYGFAQTGNVSNVSAGGSGVLADAVKFNNYGGSNTFNVDLPKGLYQVTVTVGNAPRTSIKMEGMFQMMNLTGLGATETVKIPVTDGQLNIQAVEGMSGREQSIAAVEITKLNDTGEMPPTIWLCGDSTVCNYYNSADTAQHGWGQFFKSQLPAGSYDVRNMATSGQYAKGFVDAGQFAPIEAYGKSGDYYIISIGINDSNYSNATEYYNTVTDMVKKAKAKGMTVILVKQQGRHGDLSRSPLLTGRWYGGELDKIGQEQSVQVVDLFTAWQNFGLTLGYDGMTPYYAIQANGSNDDLHQSKMGAQKIAELMQNILQIGARESIYPDENVSYTFKNVNSGLYMEVAGAKAEAGANVQQWGVSSAEAHNTWHFRQAVGDYYWIYSNLGDGETYCLYVDNGKADNGANIVISTKNGYSDQYFKLLDNGDGTVTIVTRATRDAGAIEVGAASNDSGANIQQWELNGHNCQKWIMEKVEYPKETTTTTVSTTTTTTTTTAVTTTETTSTTAPRIKRYPGDANVDNTVDIADAVFIMQVLTNPDVYSRGRTERSITEQGEINADIVDNDGITFSDALFIQLCCIGSEKLPPIEYYEPDPVSTTTPEQTSYESTTTTIADPYAGYYFAVDQQWDSGVTETVNQGYTKVGGVGASDIEGYVNLDNIIDSSITFTVNAQEAGNHLVHIRFANGSVNDRKMKVIVNGNTDRYWMQSFTSTGSWTEWLEFGIVVPLEAGSNTIKLVSATSEGGPNLDYITIAWTDEPYGEPYDPNEQQLPDIDGSKPAVYLAGDSTVQSYRESYAPQQGWGYYLQNYFSDGVNVYNNSIAGRSSKKFYDEGRFDAITANLKKGDFVMIQFAINDAGYTNEDRYAPTCGNVDNPSAGSYEWYMTQFIKATLDKGATPVLVTTTLGMKAYSNGRFEPSYTNYGDACKSLARKYNIPCIDLNTIMVNHYNSVGYDTAKSYHLMGAVAGSTDGTHFCEKGADIVAGLVAKAVKDQGIGGLAPYVK